MSGSNQQPGPDTEGIQRSGKNIKPSDSQQSTENHNPQAQTSATTNISHNNPTPTMRQELAGPSNPGSNDQMDINKSNINHDDADNDGQDDDDDLDKKDGGKERRKIEIKFIQNRARRHITFSKRKHGIMKKAWELSVLTGTQVLLLVVSETGLVYTFTTPKLQPIVTQTQGKSLIQACLNAPDDYEFEDDDDDSEYSNEMDSDSEHEDAPSMMYVPNELGARNSQTPMMYPDQLKANQSVASTSYGIPDQMTTMNANNPEAQNQSIVQAARNLQNEQVSLAYNQSMNQNSPGISPQPYKTQFNHYQGYSVPVSQFNGGIPNMASVGSPAPAGPNGPNHSGTGPSGAVPGNGPAGYNTQMRDPNQGLYQQQSNAANDANHNVDNMHMPSVGVPTSSNPETGSSMPRPSAN